MKLTKIIPQVKRADRVSVFVDEEYVFSLSLDQLVASGLKAGDDISPGQIVDYQQVSNEGKLFDRALIWALRRPHSEREIRDYLKRKTDDPDLVEVLVKKLAGKDFVDDKSFCKLWIANRRRLGYSRYVIRGELIKKGIDKDLITEELKVVETDQEALQIILAKKKNKYPDRQKLIAYLASRGFSYPDIKQALESD